MKLSQECVLAGKKKQLRGVVWPDSITEKKTEVRGVWPKRRAVGGQVGSAHTTSEGS